MITHRWDTERTERQRGQRDRDLKERSLCHFGTGIGQKPRRLYSIATSRTLRTLAIDPPLSPPRDDGVFYMAVESPPITEVTEVTVLACTVCAVESVVAKKARARAF